MKEDEVAGKMMAPHGYAIEADQVFRIRSGPLAGKSIFFVSKEEGSSDKAGALFVAADGGKIIESIQIPTLEKEWNIVSVLAVAAGDPVGSESEARILAVLKLEPLSGRSDDYWDQAFVFDLKKGGKIISNTDLNEKISGAKPSPRTIGELKLFLRKKR